MMSRSSHLEIMPSTPPRRTVLQVGFAAASVAVVVHACSDNEKEQAEEVAPPEDLMRERGVLDRVLLVYDQIGSEA